MGTTGHNRIAKNSMVLYIRMILIMGISLFSTRFVLEGLGVVEFGIYNIVGGVVSFITMITGALTISVQRFLNFELGKETKGNVSEVFTSAMIIHILLSLGLLIILETIGYWYFVHYIRIPADNIYSATVVYHLSSIAACISLLYAPFLALSIAYERMGIYSILTLIDVILRFGAAYVILKVISGRLILYGELILIVTILTTIINIIIWRVKFKDIIITKRLNKNLFTGIASFASWSAMGQIAWAFTLQGANILLNIFFGNVLNAAYGITSQVNNAVNKFVQSFQTAINPQIIKSYAQSNFSEVIDLVFMGTKLSGFLLIVIELPLFLEIEPILNIWLTNVPSYTVVFCRIMLINIFLDALSNYFATAIQATGNIRKYQIIVSSVLFLNFPLSFILIKISELPYSVYVAYGIVSLLLLFIRIKLVSKVLEKKLSAMFLKDVLYPVLRVTIISIPFVVVFYQITTLFSLYFHLLFFSCLSVCLIIMIILYTGLTKGERNKVISIIRVRFKKKNL